MKRIILNNLWAVWNGVATAIFFDVGVNDIEWWYFTMPLVVLVAIVKR